MMQHTGNLRKERRSAICNLKWWKLGIGIICYSAEEIMNAVVASSDSEQLNTDSDESDISEVESLQETFKTSSPDGPQLQKKEKSKWNYS